MSACWLKTQTSVWPQLFSVSESGYTRNRPQPSNPWNVRSTTSMSGLLQSLRADAARRRQQERGSQHGTPMPSPAASEADVQSLRSAASSRRSNISRTSQLMQAASAKSEQFESTQSEYGRPPDLEDLEDADNEDPNIYAETKSVKSAVQEAQNTQQKSPHKEYPIFHQFLKFENDQIM